MCQKVLLIDDEPTLLESLKFLLEDAGFEIMATRSAKAALDMLATRVPDTIVCDVRMPEMDGLEFTRRVRENQDWEGIPIILLTGACQRPEHEMSDVLGVREMLTKPFTVDDLIAVLQADEVCV